jgi:hypothetical protein
MAAALLGTRPLPGLWVALTAWDPEPVPDEQGHPTTPGVCTALALALAPARPGWHGLRAHVGLARGNGSPAPRTAVPARPLTLEGLLAALTSADPCPAPAVWQVAQGGWLRLERVGGGLPAPHLFRPRSGIDGWREGSGAGPGRNA